MKERPLIFSAPEVRAILEGRKSMTRRPVAVCPKNERGCFVGGRSYVPQQYGPREGVKVIGCNSFVYLLPDMGLAWRPYGGSPDVPWPKERIGEVCPFGGPGDRLWVKETWKYPGSHWSSNSPDVIEHWIEYLADGACRNITRPHNVKDGIPAQRCRCSGKGDKFDQYAEHADELRRYWNRSWPSIFMPRWASRITLEITDVRVERLQSMSEEDAVAEGCVAERWGTWWQGYRRIDVNDPECELFSAQHKGDAPPAWMIEPKRMKDRPDLDYPARLNYSILWDSINARRAPWSSNPWVFAISFRRIS